MADTNVLVSVLIGVSGAGNVVVMRVEEAATQHLEIVRHIRTLRSLLLFGLKKLVEGFDTVNQRNAFLLAWDFEIGIVRSHEFDF